MVITQNPACEQHKLLGHFRPECSGPHRAWDGAAKDSPAVNTATAAASEGSFIAKQSGNRKDSKRLDDASSVK